MNFFLYVGAIYVFMNLLLFAHLRRAFGGGYWQAPVLLFMGAAFVAFYYRRGLGGVQLIENAVYMWLGFLLITVTWFLLYDVAWLLGRAIDAFTGSKIAHFLRARRAVPVLLIWCVALFAYAWYTAGNYQVRHLAVQTDKLPNGYDTYRIAALSDVHLSSSIGPRQLERMVQLANGQKPDAVVMLGDLVDTNMSQRQEDARILLGLKAPDGKYMVLGNHEFYRGEDNALEFAERCGFTMLRGTVANAGPIQVVGADDPAFSGRVSPAQALSKAVDSRFILLLLHRPEMDENTIGRFDLQLSGHTHGGQIWPAGLLVSKIHGVPQGLSRLEGRHGKSLLYLSNGIGYWGPPIRLWTPPELVIIDLVRTGETGLR